MPMRETFRLAPMAPPIRWLTWALLMLPAGFVAAGLTAYASGSVLRPVGVLLIVLYAAIWIWWRPGRFQVSDQGLALVFPGRRKLVPAAVIADARVIDVDVLRERFGTQLRVGVGGLWGGFGWLWSRRGWTEFYVSTLDGYVLIERRGAIPLLVSPEEPQRMAAALRSLIRAPR
jgi:hypothetical protein